MDIDTNYKKIGSASLIEENELAELSKSMREASKSGVELSDEEEGDNDENQAPEKVVDFHKLLDEYKARAENKLAYTI